MKKITLSVKIGVENTFSAQKSEYSAILLKKFPIFYKCFKHVMSRDLNRKQNAETQSTRLLRLLLLMKINIYVCKTDTHIKRDFQHAGVREFCR